DGLRHRPARSGGGHRRCDAGSLRRDRLRRARRPDRSAGSAPRMSERLQCITCERSYPADVVRYTCDCGSLLSLKRDAVTIDRAVFDARRGARAPIDASGVWRFREAVLEIDPRDVVTHPEGGTRLYEREGLWFKHEGENPTGSFKDRG